LTKASFSNTRKTLLRRVADRQEARLRYCPDCLRLKTLQRSHTNLRTKYCIVTSAEHRQRSAFVKLKQKPFHSLCAVESASKRDQQRKITSNSMTVIPNC